MEVSTGQEHTGRLIVLVPGGMGGSAELARQVHQLAAREHLPAVLYLMLVEDTAQALTVDRDVTMLKAVTAGDWLAVAAQQVDAPRWLAALRETYRPGDVIACPAEHRVKSGLFCTVSVHERISAELAAPVRALAGLARQESPRSLRGSMAFWSMLLILAGLLTWVEIQLGRSLGVTAGRVLLLCALLLAFSALRSWNRIIY